MAADPLVGKVLADRFEILERIGEGGTGVVYKAKQVTVDRVVAIKVLGAHVSTDPQWVKRFHNEARAAARLSNPHTVGLIDFGQTKEGLLFIAMEFLHGRSLRDEIDKVGKLSPDRALHIIAQACESVAEAHAHGIIHRDIKPDNVYLCSDKGPGDYVKVLDFSVAKLDDPNSQQTRAGVVFGTPCYMSPEQGRGAQLGPGSDIYAFGIVLYEMLTGKPPFDSKIPTEVVMMHLRDKPAPMQGVADPVGRIVYKALDKDPAKRQKSCEQLAQECQGAFAELFPNLAPRSTGPQQVVGFQNSGGGMGAPQMGSGMGGMGAPQMGGGMGGMGAPPMGGGMGAPPMGGMGGQQMQARGGQMGGGGGQMGGGGGQMGGGGGQMGGGMQHGGGGGRPGMGAPMGGQGQQQRPMAADGLQSPTSGAAGQGTMMLPDSAGIIAFAQQQAERARAQMADEQVVTVKPAGPLFWAAWVVLGVGIGLAAHFTIVLTSRPPTP